ncbi:MAG TPA: 4'-phosphopantetheinyl transferase superfamily protein [Puia sp.]|nr:4'-phosphopantetheinyl transferase superfamily protein [Puia sp.]
MNLDLYATEYLTPLPDPAFRSLLTLLPAPMQEKVTRFRNWEDQHAALLGRLLLRLALQNAGYEPDLTRLRYTPEQKPFLPEGPAFNLSHSGNRVLCLLGGHEPLGIDLESLSPLPFDDFQPQFTENEWAVILHAPSPLQAFYRFWTGKESILKADGRGLGIPLQSIDLSHSMIVTLDNTTWAVHELPLFDGYACAWSTIHSDPPPTIELHEITHF